MRVIDDLKRCVLDGLKTESCGCYYEVYSEQPSECFKSRKLVVEDNAGTKYTIMITQGWLD
jgi:uncharacterized protein YhfF